MIAYIEPCYVDILMPFAIAFSFDMIQNPFYIISASIKLIAWMDMMINVLSQRKKKRMRLLKMHFVYNLIVTE